MDAPQLRSLQIDDVAPVELAPGCTRRGLPSSGQVLIRVIDMAPGSRWPVGREHLLGRAVWDQDGVGDDIRDDLVEHLGDPGVVLVVDETGDLSRAPPPWACSARTPHRRPDRERAGRDLADGHQPG